MKQSSVLDSFLKEIKTSTYYCQPIQINLKFNNIEQISIKLPQSRQHEFIAKCPEIKFSFSQQIAAKLNQDILKGKRTRNGLICAYENVRSKHKMEKIHYFTQAEQDDIGVWQQAQDAFCVGFIVQKQGNYQNFRKRLTLQLKKCLQKKLQQVVYAKNTQSHDSLSSLNAIQKIMYKHFRFYLIYQPLNNNSLLVNRLMYYPDTKFLIKPIKLVPSKFTANKVYEQVLSFKSKYDYGYLSLSNNSKTKEIRFLLIDKFDPELNQNPPPMIGVWLSAQKFQSKQELKNYFWAVIMQYLRNPSLKIKLSLNYQNTGILFTIQRPQKINAYIFEILDQPKWNLKYNPQSTFKMPQQYAFNDQQVIVEEDKQESDIESIQNRSLMKNNQGNQFLNNYLPEQSLSGPTNGTSASGGAGQACDLSRSSVENKSVKSNDQRQLQIKFLKKQLQFYKNRCEMLQKMLNNPAMMHIQAMQMMNPLANPMMNPHMGYNTNMMYQPVGMPNPQMNMLQPMINPGMNMMNNQQIQLSQTLANSRASSTNPTQKILNESELCEQQIQIVPEPVQIKKQLAFNKKKTFEQQRIANFEAQKANLTKKQSCPTKIPSQQQTNKSKSTPIIGQFPSQQQIEMSPNAKKHYFQYDYKNISFAQDNSFQNELNSTHKFATFESNQSEIFGKSPDFKNSFNLNNFNSFDRQNQPKMNNFDNQPQKKNYNNYKEFSFDRKDNDFLSSQNSRKSPQKVSQSEKKNQNSPQRNKFKVNQDDDDDSEDTPKKDLNFISRFESKYSKKQSFEQPKEQKYNKSKAQKQFQLQSKEKESLNKKTNPKNKTEQESIDNSSKYRSYGGSIPVESKKSQQKIKSPEKKYLSSTKLNEKVLSNKPVQTNTKKLQQSPGSKPRTQPLSKTRQIVKHSDSDSDDQEVKNIAQKYKK